VHHFRIISSTGRKLCMITYENASALLDFGWTKDEVSALSCNFSFSRRNVNFATLLPAHEGH
jgi:hypothetical protein